MKPILIIPVGSMDAADIARLNDNGICTVEAKEPSLVKFLDPIPAMVSRTQVEDAAIQLSRKILTDGFWNNSDTKKTLSATLVDILVRGTKLDPRQSQAEREKDLFDDAKRDELRRLAREEAKAEREAEKKAREAAKVPKSVATK